MAGAFSTPADEGGDGDDDRDSNTLLGESSGHAGAGAPRESKAQSTDLAEAEDEEVEWSDGSDVELFAPSPHTERSRHSGHHGGESAGEQPAGAGWDRAWAIFTALTYVFLWYALSTCLSLFNKWFLGAAKYGFDYPLLLTSTHFLMQFIFSAVCLRLFCAHYRPARKITWREVGTRVVPSGLASALDIGLSNYSLVFLTLSFYTMCKSTAPVFLLGFAFLFRLERLSLQLAGVIAIISVGLLLTVYGETQFHLVGFILVMVAAVMAGLRWTLTQKKQLGIDNPFATLYFMTPIMTVGLASIAFFVEQWWELPSSPHFANAEEAAKTLALILASSLLAFCMVLSEFQLIRKTSAVTFVVAGIMKELVTVVVSHFIFDDELGPANIAGMVVVIIGVFFYNIHKYRTIVMGEGGPPLIRAEDSAEDGRFEAFRLKTRRRTTPDS